MPQDRTRREPHHPPHFFAALAALCVPILLLGLACGAQVPGPSSGGAGTEGAPVGVHTGRSRQTLPYFAWLGEGGIAERPGGSPKPWAYAIRAADAIADDATLVIAVNRAGILRAAAGRDGGIRLDFSPIPDFTTRTAKALFRAGDSLFVHLYRNKTLDPGLGAGPGPDSLILIPGGEARERAGGGAGGGYPAIFAGILDARGGAWQLSSIKLGPEPGPPVLYAERKATGEDRVEFEYLELRAPKEAGTGPATGDLSVLPLTEEAYRAALAPRPLAQLEAGLRELVQALAGADEAFCVLRGPGRGEIAYAGPSLGEDVATREFTAWRGGSRGFLFDPATQALFSVGPAGIEVLRVPPPPEGCRYTGFAVAGDLVALFAEGGAWPMVEAAGIQFILAP